LSISKAFKDIGAFSIVPKDNPNLLIICIIHNPSELSDYPDVKVAKNEISQVKGELLNFFI